MKKIDWVLAFVAFTLFIALISSVCATVVINNALEDLEIRYEELEAKIDTLDDVSDIPEEPEEETPTPLITIEDLGVTQAEIELIALITMAEAEGEPEYGQRLVIDTILNRVDHPNFPDNIHDVIYQKNAFSPLQDGRIEKCYVREDLCQLVREELLDRKNYDCVFFNSKGYSKYGKPMFQYGNHYFSSYD